MSVDFVCFQKVIVFTIVKYFFCDLLKELNITVKEVELCLAMNPRNPPLEFRAKANTGPFTGLHRGLVVWRQPGQLSWPWPGIDLTWEQQRGDRLDLESALEQRIGLESNVKLDWLD